MQNNGVKYGLITGIAMIIITTITFYMPIEQASLFSILGFIAYVVGMILAMRADRQLNGGFISFKDVFSTGFLVYVISSLLAALTTYVLYNFVDPSKLDVMIEASLDAFDKSRDALSSVMSEEQIDEAMEAIEDTNFNISTVLYNFLVGLISGALIDAICALIMKKKKKDFA